MKASRLISTLLAGVALATAGCANTARNFYDTSNGTLKRNLANVAIPESKLAGRQFRALKVEGGDLYFDGEKTNLTAYLATREGTEDVYGENSVTLENPKNMGFILKQAVANGNSLRYAVDGDDLTGKEKITLKRIILRNYESEEGQELLREIRARQFKSETIEVSNGGRTEVYAINPTRNAGIPSEALPVVLIPAYGEDGKKIEPKRREKRTGVDNRDLEITFEVVVPASNVMLSKYGKVTIIPYQEKVATQEPQKQVQDPQVIETDVFKIEIVN